MGSKIRRHWFSKNDKMTRCSDLTSLGARNQNAILVIFKQFLSHIFLRFNCRYRRSGTICSVRGWSSGFTILVTIYAKGFIKRWFLVWYPSYYRGFHEYTGTTVNLIDWMYRRVPWPNTLWLTSPDKDLFTPSESVRERKKMKEQAKKIKE